MRDDLRQIPQGLGGKPNISKQ